MEELERIEGVVAAYFDKLLYTDKGSDESKGIVDDTATILTILTSHEAKMKELELAEKKQEYDYQLASQKLEFERLKQVDDHALQTMKMEHDQANDSRRLDLEEQKRSDDYAINQLKYACEEIDIAGKEVEARKNRRVEVMNVLSKFGEIVVKAFSTATTMTFNAAAFQHLLEAEKDTTIGSTSMKTFLRGGLNIFKPNN